MYRCMECDNEFTEPQIEKTTYEDFYEVASQFSNKNEMILEKCPYCGSDDFIALEKCSRCGEYCLDSDLIDTDEINGGGIGYLCLDCFNDIKE